MAECWLPRIGEDGACIDSVVPTNGVVVERRKEFCGVGSRGAVDEKEFAGAKFGKEDC